jgi:DNA-binding response OmpR family regulator
VDILMPKLDGFQLIRQLKDKHLAENAAVIILSNLGQEEDIKKGLDLGVSGYIVKALATPAEVVNKAVDISDHKKSN